MGINSQRHILVGKLHRRVKASRAASLSLFAPEEPLKYFSGLREEKIFLLEVSVKNAHYISGQWEKCPLQWWSEFHLYRQLNRLRQMALPSGPLDLCKHHQMVGGRAATVQGAPGKL